MSEFFPKDTGELFGHAEAERQLLHDAEQGKLAHGWIISGGKGIGKATLAYRFARAMLAGEGAMAMSPEHPVFRRVAAGSHADLLVVEPIFDTKKGEYASGITVDQAREIGQFLSLTPGESQWRVVIVDSADQLNNNAANAILKILEEPPPQALLLLVSHNPGKLLPTIRSRARMLKLKMLDDADFEQALSLRFPDMESRRLEALWQLSGGSPGVAATYEEQGALELYVEMLTLMSRLPQLDTLALHAFADSVSGAKSHARFQVFIELALIILERLCKVSAGVNRFGLCVEEKTLLTPILALHPPAMWAVKWQQACDQFLLSQRLHLDYKQVVIAFFHSIASKEGFLLGNTAA